MLRIALAGVTILLVAGAGGVLYVETASVEVTLKPHSIEAIVPLAGGPNGGPLSTRRFHVSVAESQQGYASIVQAGAASASGFVRFTYICTGNCVNAEALIPAGTVVTNGASFGYSTETEAIIDSPGKASVAVRATGLGAAWNTGPETVKTIASNNPYGRDLTVTNPAAISGGDDGRLAHLIQQSDYDAVRNVLTARVYNELGAALFASSNGSLYVGDSQAAYTVTGDHAVGDETTSFTVTVTGTIGATAFSETQANAILMAALKAKVPAGQELTDDRVQFIFQGRQVSSPSPDVLDTGDDVLVTGKADGFVIPTLTPQSVRSDVRGLNPVEAARSIQRAAPGSRVEIRVAPTAMPWLPLIANHIAVTIKVEPARM